MVLVILDQQFFLAVLSSSVLSAGLTSYVNYLLSKQNYKRDYYKKLLDKRISSYEEVSNLMIPLKVQVHYKDDNLLVPQILTLGKDYFSNYLIELAFQIKNSIWLSDKLDNELQDLNILLLEISNIESSEELLKRESGIIYIGKMYSEKLKTFRADIESSIANDLTVLYDLPLFISQKKDKKRTQKQIR